MRISLASTAEGERLVVEDGERYRSVHAVDLTDVGPDTPIGEPVEVTNLRTPVRPGKIIAIGLNYLDHIREAGADVPTQPLVFAKFASSVINDGDEILVDRTIARRVDWEVELGVVIGRRASRVAPQRALEYVLGYLVANDVSARDVQFADGQWIRGKNLDGFCPLGSTVVTVDEIPDPQSLALGTEVNGVVKQRSNTAEMVFGVAELISFCSHSFVLEPGDVILTGTPWGCGEFMDPKQSLQDGDVVRAWVDPIGSVTTKVRDRTQMDALCASTGSPPKGDQYHARSDRVEAEGVPGTRVRR